MYFAYKELLKTNPWNISCNTKKISIEYKEGLEVKLAYLSLNLISIFFKKIILQN